jgi:hypothetical protein
MTRGSRRTRASLLATVSLYLSTPQAHAATCCGEASVGDRLLPDEIGAFSLRPSLRTRLGSYGSDGTYSQASRSTDLSFEVAAGAAARVTDELEVGAAFPILINHRAAKGVEDETSMGGGDVKAHARFTIVSAVAHRWLPGVATSIRVLIPTGGSPSGAEKPLASDATGQGAGEFTFGASLDKTFEERVLARIDGALGFFLPETIGAAASMRAPRLSLEAALGPVFSPVVLLAGVAYEAESPRARTDLFLSGAVDLSRTIALVAQARFGIPADNAGHDDLANLAVSTGVRVGFERFP